MFYRVSSVIFGLIIMLTLMTGIANAETYTKILEDKWDLGNSSKASPMSADVMGYNLTQGFSMPIEYNLWEVEYNANNDYFRLGIDYTLPDDGSTWLVEGNAIFSTGTSTITKSCQISEIHNTPGTFTGVSIYLLMEIT